MIPDSNREFGNSSSYIDSNDNQDSNLNRSDNGIASIFGADDVVEGDAARTYFGMKSAVDKTDICNGSSLTNKKSWQMKTL